MSEEDNIRVPSALEWKEDQMKCYGGVGMSDWKQAEFACIEIQIKDREKSKVSVWTKQDMESNEEIQFHFVRKKKERK